MPAKWIHGIPEHRANKILSELYIILFHSRFIMIQSPEAQLAVIKFVS